MYVLFTLSCIPCVIIIKIIVIIIVIIIIIIKVISLFIATITITITITIVTITTIKITIIIKLYILFWGEGGGEVVVVLNISSMRNPPTKTEVFFHIFLMALDPAPSVLHMHHIGILPKNC